MAPLLCRPQLASLPTSATVGLNQHRRLQTDAKGAEDILLVFLVERLQRLERYFDMSRRGVLREEDETYNSLSVDDVGHAPRQDLAIGDAEHHRGVEGGEAHGSRAKARSSATAGRTVTLSAR